MPKFSVVKRILGAGKTPRSGGAIEALNYRVDALPTHRTAIDALSGWSHPPLVWDDGTKGFYPDPRIAWCLDRAGPLTGRSVLELGPLDGAHTALLARAGPASILAIEANSLAYLRCLVTKEIMKLRDTRFLLGDFNAWMDQGDKHYDLVVACGVLYHSKDPVGLLKLIAASGASFYLWTHYFDDTFMRADDPRRVPFSGRVQTQRVDGKPISLHERSYFRAWRDSRFCGGFQDKHYWMTKSDITWMIAHLGFDCEISHDEPDHVNGPAFSVFARRTAVS